MSRRRCVGLPHALALALLVGGAVGCGIPTDNAPRAISRENVPDDVVGATTETTAPLATVTAPIFLVQSAEDPRLVEVTRDIPASGSPAGPDPATVLETLLTATPDEREQANGITNLIPEGTRLASQPQLARGTLVIDLTEAIFNVVGENQRAAFGQIVCTADGLDGVDAVRFQVEGKPTQVQVDSGATDGSVTCARDYRRLQ